MAGGTIKTVADLCTQADTDLPDNTQGLISPADVRNLVKDIVASTESPIGGMHIITPAVTTIAIVSTFVKAAGTTAAFTGNKQFAMPTNNRLQYTGPLSNRVFTFVMSISATVAFDNQLLFLMLAKNGSSTDAESIATIQEVKHEKGIDVGSHTVAGHITLSSNDFVELFISNETGLNDITIERMNMTIDGKFI